MSDNLTRGEIIGLVVRLTALTAVSWLTLRLLMDAIDPTRKQKAKALQQARQILSRLGIADNRIKLNEYEMVIASNLVEPNNIDVTWKDIVGLDGVVEELRETVLMPITMKEVFAKSQLIKPPKGVLLHGPPGCGKTMIAKATAREAGARFINLDFSSITDKWYGESQKFASAVFSLAQKLQPCIIFIDEVDSFLRSRDHGSDHEATAMVKAQFMQLWDGLQTDSSCIVVVMGATNRPKDVDKAILRRMPATFHIGIPDEQQRKSLLTRILEMERVSEDLDYTRLSKLTEGFSGSDLRELCRTAAVFKMKEVFETGGDELGEITNEDMMRSLRKLRESKVHCGTHVYTGVTLD